jgi:single-strand DNA-binding protein
MRTVNSVVLLGNIAREPDMKITANNKEFATFVMATHRESGKDGEKFSVSEFHNIVAWGNLAHIAKNFCVKGRLVYIEGHIKTRSWNHENGTRVFRTEIIATNIIALSTDPVKEGIAKNNEKSEIDNLDSREFFNSEESDFFRTDE